MYTASGDGLGWTTLKLDPFGLDGMNGSLADGEMGGNFTGYSDASESDAEPVSLRSLLQASDSTGSIGSLALYFVEHYELAPYYGQLISSVIFMACVFVLRVSLLGCFVLGKYLSEDDDDHEDIGHGLDAAAQLFLVSNDATELAGSDLVAESQIGDTVGNAVDNLGIDVDLKCCGTCAGIPVVGDCIVGMNQSLCVPLFEAIPQLDMLVEVFSEGSLIDRLQFPALECFAAIFALPGMAEGCAALISSGDDVAISVGSMILVLLLAFIGVSFWLLIFQSSLRLTFDNEAREYSHKDEDDVFLKLYHGYSLTDFHPGQGHTFLFCNILIAFARSFAFGAFAFACPMATQVACGFLQTFIVMLLLAGVTTLLMFWRPYLDGDDQTVEEVSAWCNLLTTLAIMALPFAAGTSNAGALGWSLIVLQVISILNQIWYNLKPLILGIAGYLYAKICGKEEEGTEEEEDKDEERGEVGAENGLSARGRTAGFGVLSGNLSKVHPERTAGIDSECNPTRSGWSERPQMCSAWERRDVEDGSLRTGSFERPSSADEGPEWSSTSSLENSSGGEETFATPLLVVRLP